MIDGDLVGFPAVATALAVMPGADMALIALGGLSLGRAMEGGTGALLIGSGARLAWDRR